jgi:hypothetical protein
MLYASKKPFCVCEKLFGRENANSDAKLTHADVHEHVHCHFHAGFAFYFALNGAADDGFNVCKLSFFLSLRLFRASWQQTRHAASA